MTNNIIKLYEVAGIPKEPLFSTRAGITNDKYFTTNDTQKMIKLFDWLINNLKDLRTKCKDKADYYIFCFCLNELFGNDNNQHEYVYSVLFQSISGLIIELYNDLTDKQREEIKEILK